MTSIRNMAAAVALAISREDSWATGGLLLLQPGPPAQTATLPSGTRGEDLVA